MTAAVTSALLANGRLLLGVGLLQSGLSGLALILLRGESAGLACALFASCLALTLPLLWYAIRVGFDARAFALIAAHAGDPAQALVAFDLALDELGLRAKGDVRALALRSKAAMGLLRRLMVCALLQFALCAAGIGVLYVY